jgi:hypothetical protein
MVITSTTFSVFLDSNQLLEVQPPPGHRPAPLVATKSIGSVIIELSSLMFAIYLCFLHHPTASYVIFPSGHPHR